MFLCIRDSAILSPYIFGVLFPVTGLIAHGQFTRGQFTQIGPPKVRLGFLKLFFSISGRIVPGRIVLPPFFPPTVHTKVPPPDPEHLDCPFRLSCFLELLAFLNQLFTFYPKNGKWYHATFQKVLKKINTFMSTKKCKYQKCIRYCFSKANAYVSEDS